MRLSKYIEPEVPACWNLAHEPVGGHQNLVRHFRNPVTYFISFRARTLAPALARLSTTNQVRARAEQDTVGAAAEGIS